MIIPCDIDEANVILSEIDETEWDLSRYNSDKLRYYNLCKNEKCTEDYTKLNINKYHRSLFAQFRCGILPLQIEIGRFRNLALGDRICPVCNDGVEDEIHFLCQCPAYDDYRNILFRSIHGAYADFDQWDIFDQFVYLMSNHQRQTIKFLSKAIPLRSELLYTHTS